MIVYKDFLVKIKNSDLIGILTDYCNSPKLNGFFVINGVYRIDKYKNNLGTWSIKISILDSKFIYIEQISDNTLNDTLRDTFLSENLVIKFCHMREGSDSSYLYRLPLSSVLDNICELYPFIFDNYSL